MVGPSSIDQISTSLSLIPLCNQPAGAAVLGLVVSKDTRQVYSLPSEKTPYLGVEPVARD